MKIFASSLIAALLLTGAASAQAGEKQSLAERLAPLVKAHKGKVALAVKHLDGGESYFLDADEVMPTASLIKFPILLDLYQQVSEGKLKLSEMVALRDADKVPGSGILTQHFSDGATFPLRDAARLMMVYSDNTATNMVLDKTGIVPVNERMRAWGCPNTRINAKVFRGSTTSVAPERTKKYGLGSTTAREMVQLLEKVYKGEIVSPAVGKEIIDIMKKCEDKDKLKHFLPASVVVANKSGSVSDIKTDAGIMYFPGGPVAICVLTSGNADKRYATDNVASIFIGRVAEQVHQHFVKKSDKK
jgi:beta-lactamase class A